MARSRLDLQRELRTLAPKVWYVRPPDNRMTYPCILYRPSKPQVLRADNRAYLHFPCYNVIYISQTANDEITAQMLEAFTHCDFDREYESDGLFHYSFTIYY